MARCTLVLALAAIIAWGVASAVIGECPRAEARERQSSASYPLPTERSYLPLIARD